jgi:hypothetical protein
MLQMVAQNTTQLSCNAETMVRTKATGIIVDLIARGKTVKAMAFG